MHNFVRNSDISLASKNSQEIAKLEIFAILAKLEIFAMP